MKMRQSAAQHDATIVFAATGSADASRSASAPSFAGRVAEARERRGEQRDPEALVEAGHAALAVEVAHRREEAGARRELDVDRRAEPHEQQHLEDHGRGARRAAAERGAARLPEERRAGPPPRGRALDLHGVRRLALGHDVARAEASERDGCFFFSSPRSVGSLCGRAADQRAQPNSISGGG